MSVAEFFLSGVDDRVPTRRDQWGRYLIPDPKTGVEKAWTRATTMAKACADTYALERWAKRMVGIGVALREDFQIAILAATDTKELDRVIEMAKEHAGGSIGSRHGTAMHALSERVDRGETFTVSPAIERDVSAYRVAIAPFGIEAIERIVVLPDLGVAGTLDRIVRWGDALYILDLKTGADLAYAWLEIAVQLRLYASAPLMWDPKTNVFEPMPPVSQTKAFVVHVPKGEGTAQVYEVDISTADELIYLCTEVRRVQKLKGFERAVTPAELMAGAGTTMSAPASAESVPQPDTRDAAAGPPESPLGGAEPNVIEFSANGIRWPFNPAADSGFRASDVDLAALAKLIGDTPADIFDRLQRWAVEANEAGRGFDIPPLTQRQWTCLRAALLCALHLLDWQVYLGLSRVLDAEIPPNWSIGATIGSLDQGQADRLATLALGDELDPF